MSVLRTGAGLVLIDTSNYRAREKTFAAVRAFDGAPLDAAIYTHGHADHACGMPPFPASHSHSTHCQRPVATGVLERKIHSGSPLGGSGLCQWPL